MYERFKQAVAHWNTRLVLFSTIMTGLTGYQASVQGGLDSLRWLNEQEPWVRWGTVGLFATIAVWSLFRALSRKSTLRRPERFVIRVDRPEHLVGRDVESLARHCEQSRLIFLPGESGSGKSALVRAGLVQWCRKREEGQASRLLPVYIDGALLDWDGGLSIELIREFRDLTSEELADLGANPYKDDSKFSSWIRELPVDAVRQMLIVVDQFDDYATRCKDKLVTDDGPIIEPVALRKCNRDWRELARAIEEDRIRVLFVCRDDMYWALSAVRFENPLELPPLERLNRNLVEPFLDALTVDDGKGEIVRDAAFGWERLKARLLRDLAKSGGVILPIQMSVAVQALQHLRCLTVAEYEKKGGLPGLERFHIKSHVDAAARCGVVPRGMSGFSLLRGLVKLLVTEDGHKTRIADIDGLAREILGPTGSAQQLEPAVAHLEKMQIVRRRPMGGRGAGLLLYHDFLTRGVRDAWLRANGSHELLRQHQQELDDASTWRQSWGALLSLGEQAHLAGQRLRGQLRYGPYRRVAIVSLLRLMPVVVVMGLALVTFWQWSLDRERRLAESCIAIGSDMDADPDEVARWIELAGLSEAARIHALKFGLEHQPDNISRRVDWIIHVVVGLDPGCRIQEKIADNILLPIVENPNTNAAEIRSSAALLQILELRSYKRAAQALGTRMTTETSGALAVLGDALGALSENLDPMDLRPIAEALTARMSTESNSRALSVLGHTLGALGENLGPEDLRPGAQALVARMKTETDSNALSSLGRSLGTLGVNLGVEDLRTVAQVLVTRMKTETDYYTLTNLGQALGGLGSYLDSDDLRLGVQALVAGMTMEMDPFVINLLGEALVVLGSNLDAEDLRPSVQSLGMRITTETNAGALSVLGGVLGALSGNLDPMDLRPIAVALVARMSTESDSWALSVLGHTLGALGENLGPEDLRPGAQALVARMKTETDSDTLSLLGETVGVLGLNLDADDLRPSAQALTARMKTETDSDALSRLGRSLGTLGGNLDAEDLRPGAQALVARMKTESDSDALSRLGHSLETLGASLDADDLRPGVQALVARMKTETGSYALSLLGERVGVLGLNLDPENLRLGVDVLRSKIRTEYELEIFENYLIALSRIELNIEPEPAMRLQHAVDLIQLPQAVEAHDELLKEIEKSLGLPPETFGGNVRRFANWLETDVKAKTLNVNLDFRPHGLWESNWMRDLIPG